MLCHQFTNFCEDQVCRLLVIGCKPVVYLDGSRDTGEKGRIGGNEVDVQVGQNIQAVKYLVCWD
jgi:hypothetical protein